MTTWNDDRLDELNERVKDGFKTTRDEMGEIRTELRSLNERFDRLYYTLLVTLVVGVGSFFVH